MIRFKNIRFNRGVKFFAKTVEWFTQEEGHEIWLDDDDHVWIAKDGYKKLVSGVPYDAETFPEDSPRSPSEMEGVPRRGRPPKAPEPAV